MSDAASHRRFPGEVADDDDIATVLNEAAGRARLLGGSLKPHQSVRLRRARQMRQRGSGPWSGPGPDHRDPSQVGSLIAELVRVRGWDRNVTVGSIEARWADLVGPVIAEHARPEVFREGKLTIRAKSTAWATQLGWLKQEMLTKFAAKLGDDVITAIEVTGPVAPSWVRGPLRVKGRGPRDTYG